MSEEADPTLPPEPPTGSETSGGAGGPSPGTIPVNIEDEVRRSFLDYSMSVIIGRALPDVRDGLKPVHRRILYAMNDEGLLSTRPYSKSAGVVGEVIKHYHPHGDQSIYDALVRMVQDFSLRCRSDSAEIDPFPINVVAAGSLVPSTSLRSASDACPRMTPFPESMMGCCAEFIFSAAVFSTFPLTSG
jgi:hypothetical protein